MIKKAVNGYSIGSEMRMTKREDKKFVMKIWGAGTGFTGFDSSSGYAQLIGRHIRLIYILVCDWLKGRQNLRRLLAVE